ncbi:hypothetical protein ACFOUP_09960 [Belliella kenyensis]|uniref:Uncharacterized protein n=1 Tax=Belliella kenyensis TaxID=1472724 RepID=A0ABV8EME4_9BACT|nr:hypothetical protein [Belliella kenyensis]MCH7403035.1 hypothetical protein [Belliella kenyensis]MDN3605071.1 hypothetical protein [Belliella kenyensis]
MKMKLPILILLVFCTLGIKLHAFQYNEATYELKLLKPGNPSSSITIKLDNTGSYPANDDVPLDIKVQVSNEADYADIKIDIVAKENVYFNFSSKIQFEDIAYDPGMILLPGYWYRKNLRSPDNAPSVRESTNWLIREDRLSTPLVSVFDPSRQYGYSLIRMDDILTTALTTHDSGEVILSGDSDLGALGFGKNGDYTYLEFAYPHAEHPYTYIRKLTLVEPVTAFSKLGKGQKRTLNYRIQKHESKDYSDFVASIWHHSYDILTPVPLRDQKFTDLEIKKELVKYFKSSYVDFETLKGFSGVHIETASCESTGILEIGFIGRVLLNAFNALEFAEANHDQELLDMAHAIFASYEANGFNKDGLIREVVDFDKRTETNVYSIRRQSEGLYAMLFYLQYERRMKRAHPILESKVRTLFDALMKLQMPDGSFPRKFDTKLQVIDETGGSTPSIVLPLAMAYQYFKDKKYLDIARKVVQYQEEAIIGPSDYFSSTLDADCEDKEASLYAATAMYYMAQITKGKERDHYVKLAKKAAYFTLSWYYTWDVPFAQGQMLGDIGLKSRGWGNVSVENNHIDVFIFEFDEVLDWLAEETNEKDFAAFAQVIRTSMREQLLPHQDNLMGIAKPGYYPEVVQHTAWDYGKNGKGFYNDIFAPGWTVASIWELLTLGRTSNYFRK